ncbi:MAG: RidA family protein [Neisseriaceae bacterium]
MSKEVISTNHAPAAIGPYAQAIKVGQTVYLSGQIPVDPKTNELVGEDFKAQTEQVFKNLSAVLQAAGMSLQNLVKITVYLTDFENFPLFNEIMSQYIKEPFPTRATVQICQLPKGASVEIDGIASL